MLNNEHLEALDQKKIRVTNNLKINSIYYSKYKKQKHLPPYSNILEIVFKTLSF